MSGGPCKSRDGSEWNVITSDLPISRSTAENIVSTTPGPTLYAKRSVSSPLTAFLQIFDESCMRKIFKHTVAHIEATNDEQFMIDLDDMYAFVGLLFARRVFLAKNEPLRYVPCSLRNTWTKDFF